MPPKTFFLMSLVTLLSACAGLNPNPGERSVDISWTSTNFERAFNLAKSHAEQGEPWAQLRLGIFYENGWGVEQDSRQARHWYEKAMRHKGTGGWANGKLIGAIGEPGYFNQNSDALIAEFNLAQLYFTDKGVLRDLPKAYLHISHVIAASHNKSVFFCCEFSEGRYFTQKQFEELKANIEADMTQSEREEGEELLDKISIDPS